MSVVIALLAAMGLFGGIATPPAMAVGTGAVNPVTGPFPQVHGEMVVNQPGTASCSSTVVSNASFANTAYGPDHAWTGTYAPACPGPWSMVVLTLSASVQPGVQFDRIGDLQLGGAELLHFTTPEGTTGKTSWSIQRDVTQYASLLGKDEPVWFQIGNVTDSTYTGVFSGTVTLTFYRTSGKYPAAPHPDFVSGLGGVAPAARGLNVITSPQQRLTSTATLPANLTSLKAEVYTSGHGPCEEDWWYQPFACAGQPYREVGVYIDGTLAGIAPVFPVIFTGGWGPDWWRPIPGPRTFDLRPYTVDLSPFVGRLTDGQPHTFAVGILGWRSAADGDYWPTAMNLLGTVNHHGTGRTLGGITSDSGAPQPTVTLTGTADAGGLYQVSHALDVAGWIQPAGYKKTPAEVSDRITAALAQAGVSVDSQWHWNVGTTGEGPATVTQATYRLLHDGARFAFQDQARTAVGSDWSETVDDRMQTSGPALVTGTVGASQESWTYQDSVGNCVAHELAASMQNILEDRVSRACPP